MTRRLFLIGIFVILGLTALGAANITYHNDTLRTMYGAGDRITGTLNVTFNKTKFDSVIRTNFEGTNRSLREFILANGLEVVADYNCSTANCLSGYTRKEEVSLFGLQNESALVGFSVQGTVTRVDDILASFQSASESSCYLSLAVDVLGRREHFLTSRSYIDETCYEARYGCFEQELAGSNTLLMNRGQEYCERITLPVAPAFRVGANVTAATQGQSGLRMTLHSMDSALLGECALPAVSPPSQRVDCIIPYSSAVQRDYLVCITPTGAGSDHKIRFETNNPCGTPDFGANYPGDYEIFAKNLKFNSSRIDLNESSFNNAAGTSLTEYVSLYLSEQYNNVCSPQCIVPLVFSGSNQSIQVINPRIRYTSSLGGQLSSDHVYRIERDGATIDAKHLVLDVSKANFTIPAGARDTRLRIYIDNEEIVDKRINLSASFSFEVTPAFAAFGQPTTFSVVAPINITSARWIFGDGDAQQTSSGKTITHRYLRQGTFNLDVEITRVDGVTSRKVFSIVVGNARDAATTMLASAQQRLRAVTANVSTYPAWIRQSLETQIDYASLNASIREAGLLYARQGANESDYALVVNRLVALDVPYSIQSEVTGTVPLISSLEGADMNTLRELAVRQEGTDDELRAALGLWAIEKSRADITFNTIMVYRDSGVNPLATIFKVQTKPVSSYEENTHLVISLNSNDIIFASAYPVEPLGSAATALRLGRANEIIEFALIDSLHPNELGAYITPSFDRLGSFGAPEEYVCNFNAECDGEEDWKNCPNDCRPWGVAGAIIVFLVLGGAIAFGAILWWYKTRYETSLFAHRQDLANVLQFISTSQRAGMGDLEIRKKLRQAGWTNEQIKYAFAEHRKPGVVYGGASDVKFIKRPDFKNP